VTIFIQAVGGVPSFNRAIELIKWKELYELLEYATDDVERSWVISVKV
jgi:hypothetical protein